MSLLQSPSELSSKVNFTGLIYGQPGIGKTTLALSSINPVCIDTDKGMYRVEKRYQVPSLQVENYQQILDLINGNEIDAFDTIVFDTLGKLIDRISDYVCLENPKLRQADGQLAMKGWGAVKNAFNNLLKLLSAKNKSVIFVAHESEEKDGDTTKKRPDVSGSARKDIVKELDWMGYMEAAGDKRTICFSPSEKFYAKNSCGLDDVIEIGNIVNGNNFIKTHVIAAIERKLLKDNEELTRYNSLIKNIDDIIAEVNSAEKANETIFIIKNLEKIWDSDLYARKALMNKSKKLGINYNKDKRKFE